MKKNPGQIFCEGADKNHETNFHWSKTTGPVQGGPVGAIVTDEDPLSVITGNLLMTPAISLS